MESSERKRSPRGVTSAPSSPRVSFANAETQKLENQVLALKEKVALMEEKERKWMESKRGW